MSTHNGHDDWLSNFGGSIRRQGEEREARRAEISAELEKRIIHFEPDPDTEGHGIGWIRAEGEVPGFLAFHRYSNGYADRPCMQLTDELIKALWTHVS